MHVSKSLIVIFLDKWRCTTALAQLRGSAMEEMANQSEDLMNVAKELTDLSE